MELLSNRTYKVENLIDQETRRSLGIIHSYCEERGVMIAAAESVSAGLLQWMLASEDSAGQYFCGGITDYNCFEKGRNFVLPSENCDADLGVSREISQQMALNVCEKFNCKLGLSLTGFANPISNKELMETFAYGSFAIDGKVKFTQRISGTKSTTGENQIEYGCKLINSCAAYMEACLM